MADYHNNIDRIRHSHIFNAVNDFELSYFLISSVGDFIQIPHNLQSSHLMHANAFVTIAGEDAANNSQLEQVTGDLVSYQTTRVPK